MVEILSLLWLTGCAAWDRRLGSVPNTLTLPVLALGGFAAWRRGPLDLVAFGAVLVVCYLAFRQDVIGGADAKILLALAGLWPAGMVGALAGAALWAGGSIGLRRNARVRAVPGMLLGAAVAWGLTGFAISPILIVAESVGGFRLVV